MVALWVWVVFINSICWYPRAEGGGSTADIGKLDILVQRYEKRRGVHGEGGLECCIDVVGFGMHGILVCKSEGRLVYRDYNREISTRYEYILNWYAN